MKYGKALLASLLTILLLTCIWIPVTLISVQAADYPDKDFTQFNSLDIVDSLNDLSKIQSVKYKNGAAIRPGTGTETMFMPNDNTLWMPSGNFSMVNELTWKINGEARVAVSAYYNYTLASSWVAPNPGNELVFYTSPDRVSWTKAEDITIQRLNDYSGHILFAFWLEETPKYTQYLKVQIPALGENIYISEVRQEGGSNLKQYGNVFYDPIDTGIKANDIGSNVYFRNEGMLEPGAGEIDDYRRSDGKLGVIRTYWTENQTDNIWVDYKVPSDTRVLVDTYISDSAWKKSPSGIILPGELRDDIVSFKTFTFKTLNPDTMTWEAIDAVMQVYPGFGQQESGQFALRGFDKVLYCIEQMPAGRTMLRIEFPNYNRTGVDESIKAMTWIPSIKSVRAQLPGSSLTLSPALDEGDLQDLTMHDDCSDLSMVSPSVFEDITVLGPSEVYAGHFDPDDTVFGRNSVMDNSSLSWKVESKAKTALIAYYHESAMTDGGTGVKENMKLTLQTGEDRFNLSNAPHEIKVLGRLGTGGYYKVAYVIGELRPYHQVLCMTYPKAGRASDIFITSLRMGGGSGEKNPRYQTVLHDPCKDDSLIYDRDGFVSFIYDNVIDTDKIPEDDTDNVFCSMATIGNYIMWEAAPGGRVTFKAHYNARDLWGKDVNGYRTTGKLSAERSAAGDSILPLIYISPDGEDWSLWEDVEDYKIAYEPAFKVDSGVVSERMFDFVYFRVEQLPDNANYVIFEFPESYENPWDFKLYDVLIEKDTRYTGGTEPDEDDENNNHDTGDIGFPGVLLAVSAIAAWVLFLDRKKSVNFK